jgi:hypothetical protein
VHAIRVPLALVLAHDMVEETFNININAIADDQRRINSFKDKSCFSIRKKILMSNRLSKIVKRNGKT